MQRIIRAVLVRELVRVLKGWNTALYLLIAIAAKVKVDMHTDIFIAKKVRPHMSPRNCQRPKNFEEAHIGSGKVSSVRRSVSCLSRFELRMRAILLLCQSVGHISEVLKYQMNKNLCLLLFQYFHA